MSLPAYRVTKHALMRFCERVRPDLGYLNPSERVQAMLAAWDMMETGTLTDGKPAWYDVTSRGNQYIDCGRVAFMLQRDRHAPAKKCVTTVIVRPEGWHPGEAPRRITTVDKEA